MIVPSDADFSLQTPPMFSSKGRIGRLRWLAYGGAALIVFYFVSMGGQILLHGLNLPFKIFGYATTAGFFWYLLLVSMQRSQDIGWSRWFGLVALLPMTMRAVLDLRPYLDIPITLFFPLLMLVALLPFVFAIIPGKKIANEFGQPTIKNTVGVYILAGIFPFLITVFFVIAFFFNPLVFDDERPGYRRETDENSQRVKPADGSEKSKRMQGEGEQHPRFSPVKSPI